MIWKVTAQIEDDQTSDLGYTDEFIVGAASIGQAAAALTTYLTRRDQDIKVAVRRVEHLGDDLIGPDGSKVKLGVQA